MKRSHTIPVPGSPALDLNLAATAAKTKMTQAAKKANTLRKANFDMKAWEALYGYED